MKHYFLAGAAAGALIIASNLPAYAQMNHDHHMGHSLMEMSNMEGHDHNASDILTPIGVMGNHTHTQGDWMVSYRYMHMDMGGNRNGTNKLSPLEISGDFANTTGVGPATLRIVPTEMSMDMHMPGVMYAPTDWVTLMAMGSLTLLPATGA